MTGLLLNINSKLLHENKFSIISLFNFNSCRKLSQLKLPNNLNKSSISSSTSNNLNHTNNHNSDSIPKKYRLGQTIHKKQVPVWQPPNWIFFGGVFARPVPVAAINPTFSYFWKFLIASSSNSFNSTFNNGNSSTGRNFNSPNWMKLVYFTFVFGLFGEISYRLL